MYACVRLMDLKWSRSHGSLPNPSKVTDQLGRLCSRVMKGLRLMELASRPMYAAKNAGTNTSAVLRATAPLFESYGLLRRCAGMNPASGYFKPLYCRCTRSAMISRLSRNCWKVSDAKFSSALPSLWKAVPMAICVILNDSVMINADSVAIDSLQVRS